MITEIPAADDFKRASINLLHMAWDAAMESLHWYEQSDVIHQRHSPEYELRYEDGRVEKIGGPDESYTPEQREAAERAYWKRQQPALSNALVLIQQAVELGLKGRIASVSPFLLIARDARDYPKGSASKDVSFSAFHSIDAAELLRVHDTVAPQRLGREVGDFWDKLRRQRNVVMHLGSMAGEPIFPDELVLHILYVNQFLHSERSWPKRLLDHHREPDPSVPDWDELTARNSYGWMLESITDLVRLLQPSLLKRYFGYDGKRRAYNCPRCFAEATKADGEHDWGAFAQLRSRSADATALYCFVCEETMPVLRQRCIAEGCRSNVLSDDEGTRGECLVCGHENDTPAEDGDAG